MDTKEVKAGEKYKLELLCIHNTGKVVMFETSTGDHIPFRESDLECVSPVSPKYDPNRPFRKGDKVNMKPEVNGRPVYIGEDAWEPLAPNEIWTVEEDELETGWVRIKTDCVHATVWHAMLELVTPVEARVSFRVGDFPVDGEWSVWKDSFGKTEIISSYKIATHPHAKEAAEAERDRLNKEHREEQSKR